jgi:MFS family permease
VKALRTRGGWVLMMVCAIYFITYMDRVNLATAAADIQREFHLSNTELGYAFSAYGYPYAFIQLIGGWLADGLGPRLVFTIFGLIFSLATVLTGFIGGLGSLLAVRALLGVGEGPSLAVATRVITNWIEPHRWSFAQGIAHTFSRVANTVTPVFVAALILQVSWRGSFIIVGVMSLVWVAIWFAFFRDHPPGKAGDLPRQTLRAPVRALFRRMLPVIVTDFCYGWSLWVCLNWLPLFFRHSYGLSLQSSALFTSGIFLAGIVGDTLGGVMSDRILARTGSVVKARRNLIVGGLAGSMLFFIPVVTLQDLTLVSISLTLAFFSMELVIAPLWAVPMDIAPAYAGTASGFMNFGSAVAGIISPWAFGWIIDTTGSWHLPFAMSAILMLAGMAAAFYMHPERKFVEPQIAPE